MSDGREAFEAVHAGTADRVMAYCLRHTDPPSAEDAVAETFAIAWRRRDELPDDPLPWLLVTARNVMHNQQRSLRRRLGLHQRMVPLAELVEPSPEVGVARRQEIARGLAELPASEREALLLVAWDGLSPTDAAKVLGINPGTLRVRIHRARTRLKESTRGADDD